MPAPRKTHYEDLGVQRDATGKDIERAYRKYRAQADAEASAPDRARDTRMRLAYETLSDGEKRAAYDALLVAPERKRRSKGTIAAVIGVVLLAAAAVAAHLLAPPPPPPPGTLGIDELTRKASQAMGRVDSVDISGKAARVGLAFAVDEGVVATTCSGITPGAQLSLYLAPRTVPVKVMQADETLGLCKLGAAGIGSWPLAIAAADPAPGDAVFATKMNAVGEVGLVEAKVKRVVPSARGKVIEMSVPVLRDRRGGPVLDARGRVVGVALFDDPDGPGELVRLTPDWAVKPTPSPAPPPPRAAPHEEPKIAPLESRTRDEIAADRRRRIEEAVLKDLK
ncbi:MAG TPA: DnaJ domain-containing protein [Usitatibacter sp.]|nr:DnaJ domain-containing protein [Usitatibacter sp.]